MQKHTLLVALGSSTLSANMLEEVRDLFPTRETRITLLQEQAQPSQQTGFRTKHKNYEALRISGYKTELRLVQGRFSDEIISIAEGEHVDVLTIVTQNLDANLDFVNSLIEDVLARVSISVLFLQADAQDAVLTTLHPAREHRSGEYSVEAILTV